MTKANLNTTGRAPTVAEMDETNALQDMGNARAKSLHGAAVRAAVNAAGKVEAHKREAVAMIGLRIISEGAAGYLTDGAWDKRDAKTVWNLLLADMALGGVMIWRDTNDVMDRIAAIGADAETDADKRKAAKERRAMATAYASRTGEFEAVRGAKDGPAKWKLADTVADLKADAFTLADAIAADHDEIIAGVANIMANGDETAETTALAKEYFLEQIDALFGASYRQLHSALAAIRKADKEAKRKEKAEAEPETETDETDGDETPETNEAETPETEPVDPIETIMSQVRDLSGDDLARLFVALQAHVAERDANAPAANAPADEAAVQYLLAANA